MEPSLILKPATPIVVDLDGTLLLGDTLDESIAGLLFARPHKLLGLWTVLPKGRAAFKRAMVDSYDLEFDTLPVREPLLHWLQTMHDQGADLHLVTAADQSIADMAAARFGLFRSAVGSKPRLNLKGRAKRDYLVERFPEGFVYCGDSHADSLVFAAASGAVLCDAPAAAATAAAKAGTPIIARFEQPPPDIRDTMRLLRVHQWTKNVMIFVPMFLGHVFLEPVAIARSLAGFLILSVLASATYMANDLGDLTADRRHRSKRNRGFASGRFSLRLGFVASPLLALLAFAAAAALSPAFAGALLFYFVLTTLYSWTLKRIPLLDVFVIGTLFTARILMGAALLGLVQSVWLLSFSMFLFFSLALAKRHVEVLAAAGVEAPSIARRGYRASDWPVTLVFGCGAGLVSVVIMLLFMTADAGPSGLYHHPQWLFVIPAALTLWIMRVWLLSHRGELNDDPVVFAIRDKASLVLAIAVALGFAAAL